MYGNNKTEFDSVILAGGFGSRLDPLTRNTPKPLMPIGEKTAFEHTVSLLKTHGYKKTAVTLMYLPDKISSYGDGGGNLFYLREEKALGSAGAVANIKDSLAETVLIISADAVCNFDLAKAKAEFLKSGCIAGILLHRVKNVGEYGSVCVTDGIITEFREKPSVRDTLSDLINTGIYFLKRDALKAVPTDTEVDFARDIFPYLLRSGEKIAGIEPSGIWFDIGSFEELHRCNMFFTGNKNRFGARCSVHPAAKIEKSVFFGNDTIGDSVIFGSIIGENVTVGNGCVIPKGCVIGDGAEIRHGVSLAPGTVIDCNSTVEPKKYFGAGKLSFDLGDEAFLCPKNESGYFVRLGNILSALGGKITVFSQNSVSALPRACEIACGAAERGADATVISGGDEALASFVAFSGDSAACAFISEAGGEFFVKIFSSDGMLLSREKLRKLISSAPPQAEKCGNIYLLPRGAVIKKYIEHLSTELKLPKTINIAEAEENKFFREAAEELYIKSGTGATFSVTPEGTRAFAVSESGREIDYWQLLIAVLIFGGKKDIFLPYDTPLSVERIIKQNGINVAFYGDSESDIRIFASSERLPRDGILLSLTAQSICETKNITLDDMVASLPPIAIRSRFISADEKTLSATVSALRGNRNCRAAGFDFGDGRVNVFPSAKGRLRLVAEASDTETAEEITLKAIEMLYR